MNASIGTAPPDALKEVIKLSEGISSAAEEVQGNEGGGEWITLAQEIAQTVDAAKKAGGTALAANSLAYVKQTQKLCSTLSSANNTLAKMRSRSFLSKFKRLFRRDWSASEIQQYRADVRSERDFFEPLASTTVTGPDDVMNHTPTLPSGSAFTVINGDYVQNDYKSVTTNVDSNRQITTNTINMHNTYRGAGLNGISE
ncbi:hypothetical protein AB1N83_005946 [Pleurotus pulmonarius]|nr:hypothetical protein EYR38_001630 [Pleurotus pulmonarius]